MAVMPWKIKQASVFFGDARSLQTAALRRSCQLFPNGHCLPPQEEKAACVVHARRQHKHSDNVHTKVGNIDIHLFFSCCWVILQLSPAIKAETSNSNFFSWLTRSHTDTHTLTHSVWQKKYFLYLTLQTLSPHNPEHTLCPAFSN